MVFFNQSNEALKFIEPTRINLFWRESEPVESSEGEESVVMPAMKNYITSLNDNPHISKLNALKKIWEGALKANFELDALKFIKTELINAHYDEDIAALTRDFPDGEIQTWTKQEAEANAYLADNNAQTPFIDALAKTRGVKKDVLVEKILEKANLFAFASAQLTGKRQKLEDSIGAAKNAKALEKIEW